MTKKFVPVCLAFVLCAAFLLGVGSVSAQPPLPNKDFKPLKPQLPQPSQGAEQSGLGSPGREIPAWKARLELARLLSFSKKYEQSIAQYQKVIKQKPDLLQARTELARVLFWAGEKEKALVELDKISVDQAGAEAKLLKADLLAGDKKYPQAVKLYRAYLKDQPRDLSARFRLAQALSWSGLYKPAIKEYLAILKEKPEDVQVRRHYAFVLSWDGKFEEAARQLEMTLKD